MKAPPPTKPLAPLFSRPTFAVVIAAYQAVDTIAEAIDSVLAQTLRPDEIVVCDDGSTDGTHAVLDRYREQVTVVRQPNRGVAAAKNAAAQAASSEFVVILDADDLYAQEHIEGVAALAAARPDIDLITTGVVVEVDGRPVEGFQGGTVSFPVDPREQRREILRHSYLACPAIRREKLLTVGGFDETLRIGSDWHCWIKLVLAGCLVGMVDAPLYHYRLNQGSVASNPVANHRANVDILERFLEDRRLEPAERAIVRRGIKIHSRTAALLDARQATLTGRPDARKASLKVVLGRHFPLKSRVKACASLFAPKLARRALERRLEGEPALGLDPAHR